ncbi:uncharacterized protein ACO6RY_06218 [Pungitius sinensis]
MALFCFFGDSTSKVFGSPLTRRPTRANKTPSSAQRTSSSGSTESSPAAESQDCWQRRGVVCPAELLLLC